MFCVINRTTFASWSKFFKGVTTLLTKVKGFVVKYLFKTRRFFKDCWLPRHYT